MNGPLFKSRAIQPFIENFTSDRHDPKEQLFHILLNLPNLSGLVNQRKSSELPPLWHVRQESSPSLCIHHLYSHSELTIRPSILTWPLRYCHSHFHSYPSPVLLWPEPPYTHRNTTLRSLARSSTLYTRGGTTVSDNHRDHTPPSPRN